MSDFAIKVVDMPLSQNKGLVEEAGWGRKTEGLAVEVPLVAGTDEHDASLVADANLDQLLEHDQGLFGQSVTRYLANLFLTQQEIVKHQQNPQGDLTELIGGEWGARVVLPLQVHNTTSVEGFDGDLHQAIVKGPNKEYIQARFQAEGFDGVEDYSAQVAQVYDFISRNSEGLRLSDNPEKRAEVIALLYKELEAPKELGNVNTNLMFATIFNQMVRLDQDRIAIDETGVDPVAHDSALLELRDLGIELESHDPSFIFARASSGATVKFTKLGIVVKSPGMDIAGDLDQNASPKKWDFERDGDSVVIHTARAAMQKKLELGIDRLEQAFNVSSGISVINGIEIQEDKGDISLEDRVVKPDLLTKADYESLVTTAMVYDKLGLENTDWSASNFIDGPEGLTLVDFGTVSNIDPDESIDDRIERVKNIAGSFKKVDGEIGQRIEALHREVTEDPALMDTLNQRAQAMFERLS
ncbi:MAG: hypothetical protein OXU45_03300 [Candidatus Melainabacteria bacterium]|nr:hypothetical protein [Candidatus Melainabacteria bacterium]